MSTCAGPETVGSERAVPDSVELEVCATGIKAIYFTARLIALVWGLLFNVFPHETDVSARAIKEF